MSTERGPQTDALTRAQEIADKFKQHQIELPGGQIVLAQGKINSRILSSLVTALKEGRPSVGTKELIAQDISAGISFKEAQASLYNSIYKLRRLILGGTGWNILTIREKRGNSNATGAYCLAITASKTTENPSMETLILTDGKTIISLNSRPKTMLQRIIDSGNNGMTTEELQQPHIDEGVDTKTASNRVHDDLRLIKVALNGTRFKSVNLTPRADSRRGERARYVFRKRSQEELALLSKSNPSATDPKENDSPVLPEGAETTIFAANEKADSVAQSPLEDPQDEANDYENTPQEIEEARQNTLKQQARLQLALNILNALKNGKLQTLDKNPVVYIQNSLPPGITFDDIFKETSEPNAKGFITESINAGLIYWNRNDWDLGPKPLAQATDLIETCKALKMGSLHSEERKKRVKQEIWTHFSLPLNLLTSSPAT